MVGYCKTSSLFLLFIYLLFVCKKSSRNYLLFPHEVTETASDNWITSQISMQRARAPLSLGETSIYQANFGKCRLM